ncbi:MAG: tetratricopeptide repeat protein [candidate division Zixibacteria bacterium]|nr:tetratricopeptide repeat protein [candidate division Zixibacteria bacterium]
MEKLRTVLAAFTAALLISCPVLAVDSLDTYLKAGADLLAKGDDNGALAEYQNALRLDADNFVAIRNIGRIYSRLDDPKQARAFLERAFKMNPTDAQVCNNLGAVFSNMGSSGEAIPYFEKAVALDSTNELYLTNLGQEYTKVGRIGLALPLLRTAWALNRRNAIIPYSMGNCFAASQSYDSAEFYYQLSAAAGGRPAELYYRLGTVQNRLGKTWEAAESFEEALSRHPDFQVCREALAMLYLADKQFSAASEQFEVLATADSSFFPAWIGLGTAYALDGKTEDSDRILKHLFAIDSTLGFKMLEVLSQQQLDPGPARDEP